MQDGSLRGPREDTLPKKIMEDTGQTALHEAAISGDEKTLQILLAGGADRNLKDHKHGNTPLHEAAWRGYSRCVKALCALPQPKNTKDIKESKIKGVLQETRGALHSALLGTRNAGGFSSLHLAAQNGHNQSCREILLAGADPDVQNNYGDTPLHTACRYGHAGATRILLSGKCDPNRTNLNGDSPLHIACAMGRRKLTRILLEAGSNQEIKNAQDESPKDIAIRKNLVEIIEILNSPVQVRTPKDRDRSSSNSKHADQPDGSKSTGAKKKTKDGSANNTVNWSPYGCHYFPDPRCFPSPKLETLPKEPLKKGEQYYLDLAGNIRKGPIGVGNTCYCGPFFRHIEDRITRNRKSIRKYVHKATERLDNKVQALALRTDDQIEQLTRSMLADRIRCEGRALHLEQWLRRGEAGRLTVGHHSKSMKNIENANTLTKSRSLEFLDDDNLSERGMQNSRSVDLLDGSEVIVHRSAEGGSSVPSSGHRASKTSDKSKDSNTSEMRGLGYSVSRRLQELLVKTNEILEMEKVLRKKRKETPHLTSSKGPKDKLKVSARRHSLYTDDIIEQLGKLSVAGSSCSPRSRDQSQMITEEMARIATSLQPNEIPNSNQQTDTGPPLSPEISKDYASQKELDRKSEAEHERSSILSGSSHRNQSSTGSPYVSDFPQGGNSQNYQTAKLSFNQDYQNVMEAHKDDTEQKFIDLITALRKDYHSVKNAIENEITKEAVVSDETTNNSIYSNYDQFNSSFSTGDQLHDVSSMHSALNGFYQNASFDDAPSSSSNTLKSEKRLPTSHDILDGSESQGLPELTNSNEIKELKHRILNGSNWRSEVLKQQTQQQQNQNISSLEEPSEVKGVVQKLEIRNSEVKTLKFQPSSNLGRNKVQKLVARIQGDLSKQNNSGNYSESSEDEQENSQQNSIPNEVPYYYNRPQPQVPYHSGPNPSVQESHVKAQAQIIDTRNLIPKDAYFHDLPNKNRLRPVADKLPDKQMLQFNEPFQMARTRNPLPYEYDIEISSSQQSIQYIPPHPEKLLSNRKFSFTSDHELTQININPRLQQPLQIQMPQMTPEQAQLERDANNDSGYSTKICGSSHGPSPSLSGHTDYSGMGGSGTHTPGHSEIHHQIHHQTTEHTSPNDVPYYMGNIGASSLV
ncbi:uncharacterized protein LOC119655603 [Hermetia illucens]|nr:uncharacterized protein LOC119655603 [Hermetia illucens]XP_037917488.1 uncharacterized protein LOC119655603 [Hermetia illucens]